MKIKFKRRQRKRIRKFLSGVHGKERTNSWLENYRRLCRNYERYLSSARAMTFLATILFMLRYC